VPRCIPNTKRNRQIIWIAALFAGVAGFMVGMTTSDFISPWVWFALAACCEVLFLVRKWTLAQ